MAGSYQYGDDGIPIYQLHNDDVNIVLNEDENDAGELKSTVMHRYGNTTGKGYSATFRRLEEAHGSISNAFGEQDDASLLVLKIVPKTDSIKRRFKDFTVTLVLEPSPDGSNYDPPSLEAFEPAAEGEEYFQEHITDITKTNTNNGTLTLKPPAGAEAALSTTRAVERQFKQRRLLKLTADTLGLRPGIDTEISFHIQPAVEEDGIGDSLAVALIIKRAPGTCFFIKATTSASVTFRAEDAIHWRTGRKLESLLRLGPFGPTKTGQQTNPAGVDVNNLKAASNQILKEMAYLHLPEKGTKKLFLEYQENGGMETSTLTSRAPVTSSTNATVPLSTSAVVEDIQDQQNAQGKRTKGFTDSTSSAMTAILTQDETRECTPPPSQPRLPQLPQPQQPLKSSQSYQSSHQYSSAFSRKNSRAVRHRMMASLYQSLAQLHLDEAEDIETFIEKEFTDATSTKDFGY